MRMPPLLDKSSSINSVERVAFVFSFSRSRSKSSLIVLATVLVLTPCRDKLCLFQEAKEIITEDVDWLFFLFAKRQRKKKKFPKNWIFNVMSASGMRHTFYGKHRDFPSNKLLLTGRDFTAWGISFHFPETSLFSFSLSLRKWSSHYNDLHQLASPSCLRTGVFCK